MRISTSKIIALKVPGERICSSGSLGWQRSHWNSAPTMITNPIFPKKLQTRCDGYVSMKICEGVMRAAFNELCN